MIASALLTGVPQSGRVETGEVQTAMQVATVKGLVVDANGEPIIGASVLLERDYERYDNGYRFATSRHRA